MSLCSIGIADVAVVGPSSLAESEYSQSLEDGSNDGIAPVVKEFMKFETSSKAFRGLPVRTVSSTVDAIVLQAPKSRPLV